jgi:hypothetical protein
MSKGESELENRTLVLESRVRKLVGGQVVILLLLIIIMLTQMFVDDPKATELKARVTRLEQVR